MVIWKAQRTLLIVGEGRSEWAFLRHVKNLYVPRGCGLQVTIKNARGLGARHVVEWTARQSANAAYDQVAALFDTDTGWSPAVARFASSKRIRILTSAPCLEAVLLRILGKPDHGDAPQLKKRFAEFVADGTKPEGYAACFPDNVLRAARSREATLEALLQLLE